MLLSDAPDFWLRTIHHYLDACSHVCSCSAGNTFPFMVGRVSYTFGFQACGCSVDVLWSVPS